MSAARTSASQRCLLRLPHAQLRRRSWRGTSQPVQAVSVTPQSRRRSEEPQPEKRQCVSRRMDFMRQASTASRVARVGTYQKVGRSSRGEGDETDRKGERERLARGTGSERRHAAPREQCGLARPHCSTLFFFPFFFGLGWVRWVERSSMFADGYVVLRLI